MPKAGDVDIAYPTLLQQENKIRLLEPFKGAKQHHQMQCMVCNHIWIATPLSKRQTLKKNGVGGCPQCNVTRKEAVYMPKRQNVLRQLKERGIEVLDSGYDGRRHTIDEHTYSKILVKNTHCGHEFYCSPSNLIMMNVECSICGPQKRAAPLTAWSKANSAQWKETATEWQRYKAEVSSLTEQTYKQYKKQINPHNLLRGKAGIDGAYHLDHIVPKRFCFDNNIPPELCADHTNLQMIGWRENVGSRNHIKGTIPPIFFNHILTNSKLEQYATTLKQIFPAGRTFVNVADVIVTIYDELSNRAIIVLPIDQSHANLKSGISAYKSLTSASIPFTILFEDEMANTQLLAAKLTHYTQSSQVQRIHARDCVIAPCGKDEKKQLLNENHVQGNDNAQLAYGAYHKDQLVAVMTFTTPRVALGQKDRTKIKEGTWELSRFCTDVKYRIPGIASKILTHFKRNHVWKEIYSYADKRWSVGNMYHQLGFELIADNPPDYFYVINGVRKHRWNYRKDILKNTLPNYDPKLTEYQNMVNHGFWRVWDCGTLKYSITNKDYIK